MVHEGLRSQDFQDDAALWMNIYLEKKINKKIHLHLNQKNRFADNIGRLDVSYADFGITYNFNRHVRVMFDYVFAEKRRLDYSFSNNHQFYGALILRQKLKKFTFSYRNMVTANMQDIYSSYDGRVPVFTDRNKLTVKYELNKRYSFYTAEELYMPFYQAKNKTLSRSRTFAGVFYRLTKDTEFELYFAFQRQLNAFNVTKRVFIYGIGYSWQF